MVNKLNQTRALLKELENDNQHTEWMLEQAKFINNTKFIRIFKLIMELHAIEGYMPTTLSNYRYEVYQLMKSISPDTIKTLNDY